MEKGYCGRFAPSPTGDLHLGNLRTALMSWIKAKTEGGRWLLRIDDLDVARNRNGALESIIKDLLWLELKWDDEIIFQSKRISLYESVLDSLRSKGLLYPCRCTRKSLSQKLLLNGKSLHQLLGTYYLQVEEYHCLFFFAK